jgi:Zn-finger nucleic acid-binding protein
MKKCHKCNAIMKQKVSKFEDGVEYEYHHCPKCGEEFLDMAQLHEAAEKHRALQRAKEIEFGMWGNSIGIRIPKRIADAHGMKPGKKGFLVEEKDAVKIIVA